MSLLVQKFGGTSVGDLERIRGAAVKVKAELDAGNHVAVVVSAMAGVTNQLVDYCRAIMPDHDSQEYDGIVATGEQVTSGLFSLALQALGIKSRSWHGWQIPILTDGSHGKARIREIHAAQLKTSMLAGEVPVVSGFQGVSAEGRITTLGRGGSDTSAVALAAALGADRCDIYTDVDGVYTTDPRIVLKARRMDRITYEEMLEMASQGAKVLQTRSVEMAMRHRVRVQVLSTFAAGIGSDLAGTLVVDEDEVMEQETVSGIAYSRDEAKVTLIRVADRPGVAAAIFEPLAEADVNVDMIVQNISKDTAADVTFTVPKADLARSLALIKENKNISCEAVLSDSNVVKISVIGVGMRSHAGIARRMFGALAEKGINIQVISTSEIKISVLIDETYTELALRALHTAYGLDRVDE
jgi:aspartate kinase